MELFLEPMLDPPGDEGGVLYENSSLLFLARSAITCSEAGGSLKGSAECCFSFWLTCEGQYNGLFIQSDTWVGFTYKIVILDLYG